jgi:signal transduction histidine kinase/ActR/RegA family two-component response regulator
MPNGYVLAVILTAAAALLRLALSDFFGDASPFFAFIMAVLVTGRFAGIGPGVFATVLGALAGMYLFITPTYSLWDKSSSGMTRIGVFCMIGVGASWICGGLYAAKRRIEDRQKELEQEVRRRLHAEEQIRSIVETLKEADRSKDEFLATLAHELRNPLAPISYATGILQTTCPPDSESQRCRDVIDRQVRHMARLLEDLLDISRISRNRLELRKEQIDLDGVLQSAIETSRPLIETGGQEFTFTRSPEPLPLDADPLRLTQVFSNLLNNAAKYTDRGGRIGISCERQGSDAVVSVADTGIGIAATALPRIFEMFSQATPALARPGGGLGIGLALARKLIEMHDGTIEARSGGPGQGSEFIVRLPIKLSGRVSQPVEIIPAEFAKSTTSRRLLIADDYQVITESLATLLRLQGHEVHTAYDGEQALQAIETLRPDAALLDIGMPKLDGYQVARQIRQQPWGKDLVLMAVTGWGGEDDKRRTREAGFDQHLVKPLQPDVLIKLLAELPPTPAAAESTE